MLLRYLLRPVLSLASAPTKLRNIVDRHLTILVSYVLIYIYIFTPLRKSVSEDQVEDISPTNPLTIAYFVVGFLVLQASKVYS